MEEELFSFSGAESLAQNLKQIEFECLNLNITCPGDLTRESRLPVMVWIHGCAHPHVRHSRSGSLTSFLCRHKWRRSWLWIALALRWRPPRAEQHPFRQTHRPRDDKVSTAPALDYLIA
jgi:hypothetical protein